MEVGSDGRYVYFRVIFAIFLLHRTQGCQDSAVGIADRNIIPDNRFTASSQFDSRYAPKNARLNGATKGWGPKTTTDPDDYLQIDLGHLFAICAVATQGCNDCNEKTTQYKISTSVDNSTWTTYKSGPTDKLFPGNTDSNTVVKNVLHYPVLVRYIKFIPTTYNTWKVLRVEAFSVRRGLLCRSLPVGIGSGKIPDSDMTSSTAYNSTTSPSKARLNYTAGSSWCAATSDSSPYLQINLGSPYIICGIATQGDHMTDQWVQSYNMLTSNDGTAFTKYTENSQVKYFVGNFDSSNTAVKNLLYDGTVSQYIRVAPTSHYGSTSCMRTELYGIKHNGGCTSMFVGLSYSSIIPDHRFTASSYYDNRYKPHFARLSTSSKAWAPKTKSGEWLQIDLGSVVFVCAVATQGAGADLSNEFVRKYKIKVSLDNVNWNYYQKSNGDEEFTATDTDRSTIVTNKLENPVKAKFIRFYPTDYGSYPTMRAEVYGISSACSSPVGLEAPGIIQDSQITSSSLLNSGHAASHGRLYGSSAWCSSTSSNTQYIQINLGQVMTVTGIATQGDHTMEKWVRTYTIRYSMDGILWKTYKAGSNSDKIFQGNSDKENIRVQWLSHPVTARHVRVTPQTWNTAICMRIELYVCDYDYPLTLAAPTVHDINSTSVTVRWIQPALNASQASVTTYVLQYQNITRTQTISVSAPATSHVITGLAIYTNYNVKIIAISRIGSGQWSATTDFRTDSALPVGFPYSVAAVSKTSQSIYVTWQAPTSGINGPFLGYRVFCRSGNERHENTSQQTSHTFSGLRQGTVYNVTVVIRNDKGDGPINSYVLVQTLQDDYPLTLAAPTVHDINSTSVTVRWIQPALNASQASVTTYVLQYQNITHTQTISVSAPATSHVITGLTIYTNYNVQIKAISRIGSGQWSATTDFRTDSALPVGFPYSIAAVSKTSQSIHVTWLAPTSGINGPFLGYRVFCTSGNERHENTSQQTSHTFRGLRQGTVYNVTVVIRNDKGDGPINGYVRIQTLQDGSTSGKHPEKNTA